MRLTKHDSSFASTETADDLLRPPLESYSTTVLIAELARRGVFQSVPEFAIDAEPGESFDSDDGDGGGPSRSRPCSPPARPASAVRGHSSVRARPALPQPD
jgi:hypothetical protein